MTLRDIIKKQLFKTFSKDFFFDLKINYLKKKTF